ncbi:MAG: nucleotidyltransferase family protein [Elusimicrobiota bacterium]
MNRKTKKEIDKIKETIISILEKYNISKAGIFGSLINGNFKENSDVDILIKIPDDSNLDLLDFVHIKNEIEDAIGRKVDLIEYSAIHPALKEKILKEEVPIL